MRIKQEKGSLESRHEQEIRYTDTRSEQTSRRTIHASVIKSPTHQLVRKIIPQEGEMETPIQQHLMDKRKAKQLQENKDQEKTDVSTELTNNVSLNNTKENKEEPIEPAQGNHNTGEDDEGYTVVYRKRHRRQHRPHIIGTGTTEDTSIEDAETMAWIYVGRLSQCTTTDKIINFLGKRGLPQDTST